MTTMRLRPAAGVSCQDYLDSVLWTLRRPLHGEIAIEFTPFRGWFICGEPRAFNDDGRDFMGRNWIEAERNLRSYLR